MKQRKLFAPSPADETISCEGCDPYQDTYALPPPTPAPYALPPPPPAPPLPPLLSPPTKHGPNILPYVISIATLLSITFLIASYYLIIVKNCIGLNLSRFRRPHEEDSEEEEEEEEGHLEGNRGPVIDHPIWYIRTIGLQPSIINSIAVFKYKKGDTLIEGTQCSICLSEFQDDDILRLLPKCDHAFHIPCIDTWLRSHTNCPVCRSGIIAASTIAPLPQNENDQVQGREAVIEARNSETEENRERVGNEDESAEAENAATRVIDAPGEIFSNQERMQQIRRSVSAGCSMVEKIRLGVHLPTEKSAEESMSDSKTTTSNAGANASRPPGSSSMKRSSSCGGRSFFSRDSRSLSSVLPL